LAGTVIGTTCPLNLLETHVNAVPVASVAATAESLWVLAWMLCGFLGLLWALAFWWAVARNPKRVSGPAAATVLVAALVFGSGVTYDLLWAPSEPESARELSAKFGATVGREDMRELRQVASGDSGPYVVTRTDRGALARLTFFKDGDVVRVHREVLAELAARR
jgi:hypothetical protein